MNAGPGVTLSIAGCGPQAPNKQANKTLTQSGGFFSNLTQQPSPCPLDGRGPLSIQWSEPAASRGKVIQPF